MMMKMMMATIMAVMIIISISFFFFLVERQTLKNFSANKKKFFPISIVLRFCFYFIFKPKLELKRNQKKEKKICLSRLIKFKLFLASHPLSSFFFFVLFVFFLSHSMRLAQAKRWINIFRYQNICFCIPIFFCVENTAQSNTSEP